jgi:hypothetical protein
VAANLNTFGCAEHTLAAPAGPVCRRTSLASKAADCALGGEASRPAAGSPGPGEVGPRAPGLADRERSMPLPAVCGAARLLLAGEAGLPAANVDGSGANVTAWRGGEEGGVRHSATASARSLSGESRAETNHAPWSVATASTAIRLSRQPGQAAAAAGTTSPPPCTHSSAGAHHVALKQLTSGGIACGGAAQNVVS